MVRVYFTESETDYWLKRFLEPGFSHCFVVINGIVVNPCFHYTEVSYVDGDYRCTAYVDLEFIEPAPRFVSIWRPYTCVEVVKRVLGITANILTPYQLYRYLKSWDQR